MIEGAVAEIEGFTNDFLGEFTDGLSIEFRTQRENKTSSSIRETLDILVSDANGTRDLSTFSGGEHTRVDFALAVGISRFLASHGEGSVDSFTVDEPTFLDKSGFRELTACLHILARSVPFVLLVTHEDTLVDAMPQRISVTKGTSGSRVEVQP
jgi:exonuclease SbcC